MTCAVPRALVRAYGGRDLLGLGHGAQAPKVYDPQFVPTVLVESSRDCPYLEQSLRGKSCYASTPNDQKLGTYSCL